MSDGPSIEIRIEAQGWTSLGAAADWAKRAIAEAIRQAGATLRPGIEISILLSDDRHMRELNRRWRGRDAPTNVLSFPAVAGNIAAAASLGDIVLAYETAAREAEDEGKRFEDHATHLLVHGFLHILGYDHRGAADAAAMEGLERDILARLGIADPYVMPLETCP